LTLKENSEIYYNTSATYAPDHASGVRYDDPAFGIDWPGEAKVMSDNDINWERYKA